MTNAQHKWLKKLRETGFVEAGWAWGRSQRNRPLRKLVDLGLAKEVSNHPDGYYCHGFIPN